MRWWKPTSANRPAPACASRNDWGSSTPFFVVRNQAGEERVYTVYFRFVKEVLGGETSEQDEVAEIMDQHPDLDYV